MHHRAGRDRKIDISVDHEPIPHSRQLSRQEDDFHVERDELSGVQRKRAFTDYMLVNESLNNPDMRHAYEMMQLLRRAADNLGKTVLPMMNDINLASCYSDHVTAMKQGRVGGDHRNANGL